MNRRQKIIVSVTGIFIVLLVLLGLTYAYFLTRITGNSNPTSISVTTANLELVYGDGTTSILTSATPLEPGKFSSSKDFTVTNNGNALTDYAVTLEDFSITYAADTVIDGVSVKAGTVTKMEYPEDMKMEITCVIESDDEDRNGQACGNINGTLPTENSILLTNSIEVDDVHKYVLTLTYIDSGIDQSKDMNKTIKGKIDIIDPKSTIDLTGTVATYQTGDYVEINSTPIKSEIVDGKYKIIGVEPGSHTLYIKYKDSSGNEQTRGSQSLIIKKGEDASVSGNTITFTDATRTATVDVTSSYDITVNDVLKNTLKDILIFRAKKETIDDNINKTIYSESFNSSLGTFSNLEDERILSIEKDDYGTTYFYRGNVSDNYVNFAGKCWRIVRVQGDGSIKLILDDKNVECNSSSHNGNWSVYDFGDYGRLKTDRITNFYIDIPSYLQPEEHPQISMVKKFYDFQTTFTNIDKSKLKSGDWCLEENLYSISSTSPYIFTMIEDRDNAFFFTNEMFYYDTLKRFKTEEFSFKCNGIKMTNFQEMIYNDEKIINSEPMYVATLTADEMIFAGGWSDYLNFPERPNFGYLDSGYDAFKNEMNYWYSLSPSSQYSDPYGTYGMVYFLDASCGEVREYSSYSSGNKTLFRPSIILKSNVIVIGEGTKLNPYVVE